MKVIESKVEYLPQSEGLEGIYKQIETCGRTCYQSNSKITEDSAQKFVGRMIKSNHLSVLEHGTVYLELPLSAAVVECKYVNNPYSHVFACGKDSHIITNFRVLQENHWLEDLSLLKSSTDFKIKRYTFRFTCSRAIANELVRHRNFSFSQESTRYCGYDKDRFDGNLVFILPSWVNKLCSKDGEFNQESGYSDMFTLADLYGFYAQVENNYFAARSAGLAPQEARDILPNALKTELCMTGFSNDWRYLLDLRLFEKTGKVHPDMMELMIKLKAEAEKAGIWEDIMKNPTRFKE